MPQNDGERPFRLRPPKTRVARTQGRSLANAYRLIMHYARGSRRSAHGSSAGTGAPAPRRRFTQRCAVRLTYVKNKTAGQWKAHGRYIAREGATNPENSKAAGFGRQGSGVDIARELQSWQGSGDERMWKLIVSPEFGERVELKRLADNLIKQMEADLGTSLEWFATEHYNTEHPHLHIVIRGIRNDGEPLLFSRDYVKHRIRNIAEDFCTRQLGYRTELDALDAQRRETTEIRLTSLDRMLLRDARRAVPETDSSWLTVAPSLVSPGLNETARLHGRLMARRLAVLQRIGLAIYEGGTTWRVRRDLEDALRAMARGRDRQRMLAAHGALISDERLPIELMDVRRLDTVEGRILVHGQDEQSGRNYLMLEGTDGRVHLIHYTPEMEENRSEGGLRTNSFVRLRRRLLNYNPVLEITDFGNAEELLTNRRLMAEKATRFLERGTVPQEDGWGGWLGRYQRALKTAAMEGTEAREPEPKVRRERSRSNSRGR